MKVTQHFCCVIFLFSFSFLFFSWFGFCLVWFGLVNQVVPNNQTKVGGKNEGGGFVLFLFERR